MAIIRRGLECGRNPLGKPGDSGGKNSASTALRISLLFLGNIDGRYRAAGFVKG
jgi:hypothetical protein